MRPALSQPSGVTSGLAVSPIGRVKTLLSRENLMNVYLNPLKPLFDPQSIAVIGASPDFTRIGGRPIKYLLDNGYTKPVFPVNPKYSEISGLTCYPDVADITHALDLAIIALPRSLVLDAVKGCAAKGVRSAIIFSAGFAEMSEEGQEAESIITRAAREKGMRILGPNCLGLFNVSQGVYATFSIGIQTGRPLKGRIGFVSQSGAFGSHVFSLARENQVGLSYWVATGNESDVDVADCIDYLASDPDTDVIACYLEGCKQGEKLLAAFDAARQHRKPVVVLKVGRSEAGKRAALSHTAAMAGSDEIWETIFRQKGAYRAETIEEFLDVAYACSVLPCPKGDRIAVFTVSGGVGIMIADQFSERGFSLPETPREVKQKLIEILPYAAVDNPIDITGQIVNQPNLLGDFMDVVLSSNDYDMTVTFLAHGGLSSEVMAEQLAVLEKIRARYPQVPFIMSSLITPESKKKFSEAGFAVVEDPSRAVNIATALYYFKNKVYP